MKICYFSCSSVFGGVEKIVVDTINELSKKFECGLIIPKGCEYKHKIHDSVTLYEYSSYNNRHNPFLYLEILSIIRKYDIVHTHAAKATEITYRLNKLIPFSHIATKHNIRKGKIFNKVKNIISVSQEVSKTITHESKVIYFGVKKEEVLKTKENNKPFTMICVGRLDPIKGFDKLISEVSKLKFDYHLNIIGEGTQRSDLEKLIKNYNLEKKVSLLGFKDNIPEYLKNSDLQLISSLSEGFPITLIEGMIYSPIILSTPVGGIIEVLNDKYLSSINLFSKNIEEIYNDYEKSSIDFDKKHKELRTTFNFNDYINNVTIYYKSCINKEEISR
jgi:glycosyltransferase involved in cell wall biosynthesis